MGRQWRPTCLLQVAGDVDDYVTGDAVGYHCILIVGYDDAEKAWICKNSWGTGWGDKGYFRIGYGECGID